MKNFILIVCLFSFTSYISAQSSSVTFEANPVITLAMMEMSALDMTSSLTEQSYSVGQINYSQSDEETFEIEY